MREIRGLTEPERARLARVVMRRQGALSVKVALVFIAIVVGLPLVNAFRPDVANSKVLGFTATWLFLGVLIYPITVLLSFYFVIRSDKIEAECVDWESLLGRDREREEATR